MELEFIRWLRERLRPHPLLKLGPGDDAAILATADRGNLVVTTDLISDGVDFDLRVHEPRRIGQKALAVNLSDLAAMAARPIAVVVAVNLPRIWGIRLPVELYEGMLPLAEKFNVAIAGGDTNAWDGGLVISVTAFGEVTPRGPLLRSGAQPGDRIIVTGSFGGSIHGRHFDFEPRVTEALLLNDRYVLHAGTDCSDGLSLDLSRVATESKCGAVIDLDRVPVASAARSRWGEADRANAALQHALGDGEDFELILAVPPEDAKKILMEAPLGSVALTDIGEFVAEPGLWGQCGGVREPLVPRGYEHDL